VVELLTIRADFPHFTLKFAEHSRFLPAFNESPNSLEKEPIMAENPEQQVIDTLRDANQTLVENVMSAQQRNLKYAQGIFASAMEVLKSNVASTRSILEKQQETLQKLSPVQASSSEMAAYADLIRLPLLSFQQGLDLLETISQQGLESFQRATENFEQVTQQGLKQWQEAVQQIQHHGDPGK